MTQSAFVIASDSCLMPLILLSYDLAAQAAALTHLIERSSLQKVGYQTVVQR